MLAQHVAGGAGNIGDDRRFAARQAFSRLDFPAFGRPAITTFIPSRSRLPWRASARTASRSAITSLSWASILPSERKSISSSGKSIAAST
jgi:hypothetical protein